MRHACYAGHEHPINFNLGRIEGGEWTSSVPTHCRIDMRLGFYPGRTPAEVRAEVEAHLKAAYAAHPMHSSLRYEVSYQGFQAQGLVMETEQPVIQQLMQCHHDIAGSDEWVSISSLQRVTAVLALFMARWCGLNRRQA